MTAVEWLEKRFYFTNGQLIDIDFEQAKQMEKQQIIDAYKQGCSDSILAEKTDTTRANEYYNETFKSE